MGVEQYWLERDITGRLQEYFNSLRDGTRRFTHSRLIRGEGQVQRAVEALHRIGEDSLDEVVYFIGKFPRLLDKGLEKLPTTITVPEALEDAFSNGWNKGNYERLKVSFEEFKSTYGLDCELTCTYDEEITASHNAGIIRISVSNKFEDIYARRNSTFPHEMAHHAVDKCIGLLDEEHDSISKYGAWRKILMKGFTSAKLAIPPIASEDIVTKEFSQYVKLVKQIVEVIADVVASQLAIVYVENKDHMKSNKEIYLQGLQPLVTNWVEKVAQTVKDGKSPEPFVPFRYWALAKNAAVDSEPLKKAMQEKYGKKAEMLFVIGDRILAYTRYNHHA